MLIATQIMTRSTTQLLMRLMVKNATLQFASSLWKTSIKFANTFLMRNSALVSPIPPPNSIFVENLLVSVYHPVILSSLADAK